MNKQEAISQALKLNQRFNEVTEKRLAAKEETVNHPPHYSSLPAVCDKCGDPIECIEIVRHLNFNIGNAIKYLWRYQYKNNAIEDLKKAIFYIEDEIKRLEKEEGIAYKK